MGQSRGNKIALLISLAVSAGLIGFVLWDLEWSKLKAELWRVQPFYLLLVPIVIFASYAFRALRWRYLLPNSSSYGFMELFNATAIGILGLFVLPLRAGEFVRPLLLSRAGKVSFSAALASVVNERIYDVIAVLLMLGLCLSQMKSEIELINVGARVLGTLAGAIILVVLAAYFRGTQLINFGTWVSNKLIAPFSQETSEKVISMGKEFVNGLRAIETPRDFALVLFWTLMLWTSYVLVYQLGMFAFGEFPSVIVGCVLCVMIGLAIAAPAAPGFIGTFQFGCVLALTTVYGYSQEYAVAYSILLHLIQAVFAIVLGTIVLNRSGLSIWQLKSESIQGR